MTDRPIRVALTQGDTNGIGYEIIFKAFDDPTMFELCTPIVYGSPKVAAYHRNALGMQVSFNIIDNAADAQDGKLNLLPTTNEETRVEFGQPSAEAGHAALSALERAMHDYATGAYDVLVTAPIDKSTIQGDGFHFVGHTEYIEDRVGGGSALMVLANGSMRVALVTTHMPLKDIAGIITRELIVEKATLLHGSLRRDFNVAVPRIAVLSLNPHAGDQGVIGLEEGDVITPAVKDLNAAGIHAYGPYAADGFFGRGTYAAFDGILAMYHDQGLAPFKALDDGTGVNFTAGLPIVRTSPDHGTAYDIAGKGEADAASMRHAIYMAIDVYRNRLSYDEPLADPLPKLYHEKKEDGERPRFGAFAKKA